MTQKPHIRNLAAAAAAMLAGAALLAACAKEMAPQGGPRDKTAPKSTRCKPAQNTTNFNARRITLKFDEYVQLKSPEQQVVISPPLAKPLKIKTKGKAVVVEFGDTLAAGTTYNINFGDAVADYTEGNSASGLQYVFSTGGHIDSIFVAGRVVHAATALPAEGIAVGLYPADAGDSAPRLQKPRYYAVTDKKGDFTIRNIAPGSYRYFALQDIGNDLVYNRPEEQLAFGDSAFAPAIERRALADTLRVARVDAATGDTAWIDSVARREVVQSNQPAALLRLFAPADPRQFVRSAARHARHQCHVALNRPPQGPVALTDLAGAPFIALPTPRPDSILFLVADPATALADTLFALLTYPGADTLGRPAKIVDTLALAAAPGRTLREDTLPAIGTNLQGGAIAIGGRLELVFDHPLADIDTAGIRVERADDTAMAPVAATFRLDSLRTRLAVDARFEPDERYTLTVDSAALRDIYGAACLRYTATFEQSGRERYGTLFVVMSQSPPPGAVIELANAKSGEVARRVAGHSQPELTLRDVPPGTYALRYFVDTNGDGQWTTGDLDTRRQPEPTAAYPKQVTIKANWDTEVNWKL